VTSFHHQPEAQHPKSSAIHKDRPADYPIYWHKADMRRCAANVRTDRLIVMSLRRVHCASLIGQKHTQQRIVDFEMSVVINEPQFTELIHEVAHA